MSDFRPASFFERFYICRNTCDYYSNGFTVTAALGVSAEAPLRCCDACLSRALRSVILANPMLQANAFRDGNISASAPSPATPKTETAEEDARRNGANFTVRPVDEILFNDVVSHRAYVCACSADGDDKASASGRERVHNGSDGSEAGGCPSAAPSCGLAAKAFAEMASVKVPIGTPTAPSWRLTVLEPSAAAPSALSSASATPPPPPPPPHRCVGYQYLSFSCNHVFFDGNSAMNFIKDLATELAATPCAHAARRVIATTKSNSDESPPAASSSAAGCGAVADVLFCRTMDRNSNNYKDRSLSDVDVKVKANAVEVFAPPAETLVPSLYSPSPAFIARTVLWEAVLPNAAKSFILSASQRCRLWSRRWAADARAVGRLGALRRGASRLLLSPFAGNQKGALVNQSGATALGTAGEGEGDESVCECGCCAAVVRPFNIGALQLASVPVDFAVVSVPAAAMGSVRRRAKAAGVTLTPFIAAAAYAALEATVAPQYMHVAASAANNSAAANSSGRDGSDPSPSASCGARLAYSIVLVVCGRRYFPNMKRSADPNNATDAADPLRYGLFVAAVEAPLLGQKPCIAASAQLGEGAPQLASDAEGAAEGQGHCYQSQQLLPTARVDAAARSVAAALADGIASRAPFSMAGMLRFVNIWDFMKTKHSGTDVPIVKAASQCAQQPPTVVECVGAAPPTTLEVSNLGQAVLDTPSSCGVISGNDSDGSSPQLSSLVLLDAAFSQPLSGSYATLSVVSTAHGGMRIVAALSPRFSTLWSAAVKREEVGDGRKGRATDPTTPPTDAFPEAFAQALYGALTAVAPPPPPLSPR